MAKRQLPSTDSRIVPRYKLPAMYTLLRVRPRGEERFRWSGYIYDISTGGMRIELDKALEPGTEVEIRAMLPGYPHTTIAASGHIVRHHDDDDANLGPVRMGMAIDKFTGKEDRKKLEDYLARSSFSPMKLAA